MSKTKITFKEVLIKIIEEDPVKKDSVAELLTRKSTPTLAPFYEELQLIHEFFALKEGVIPYYWSKIENFYEEMDEQHQYSFLIHSFTYGVENTNEDIVRYAFEKQSSNSCLLDAGMFNWEREISSAIRQLTQCSDSSIRELFIELVFCSLLTKKGHFQIYCALVITKMLLEQTISGNENSAEMLESSFDALLSWLNESLKHISLSPPLNHLYFCIADLLLNLPFSEHKEEFINAFLPTLGKVLKGMYNNTGIVSPQDNREIITKIFEDYDTLLHVLTAKSQDIEVINLHRSGKLNTKQLKIIYKLIDLVPATKIVYAKQFQPEIISLLGKAHVARDKSDLMKEVAIHLENVVKKDDTGIMKTILKSASLSGELLLTSDTLGSVNGYYYPKSSDIIISTVTQRKSTLAARTSEEITSTIIHELTHKSMKLLFNNVVTPYYYSDRDAEGKLREIIINMQKGEGTKDHHLFKLYPEKDYPSEVIAYYIEDKALQSIESLHAECAKSSFLASSEFAEWIKTYINPVIEVDEIISHYLPSNFSVISNHVRDYYHECPRSTVAGETVIEVLHE